MFTTAVVLTTGKTDIHTSEDMPEITDKDACLTLFFPGKPYHCIVYLIQYVISYEVVEAS